MFTKNTYIERRRRLKQAMGSGLLLFFGNNESPANYPANGYKYRQDSCFLYYFGLQREGLAAVIDIDNNEEIHCHKTTYPFPAALSFRHHDSDERPAGHPSAETA